MLTGPRADFGADNVGGVAYYFLSPPCHPSPGCPHPNPYHNSVHAADVMHIVHYILGPGELKDTAQLTDEVVGPHAPTLPAKAKARLLTPPPGPVFDRYRCPHYGTSQDQERSWANQHGSQLLLLF